MEPLSIITAIVGIASAAYTIFHGVTSQNENTIASNKQNKLAQDQLTLNEDIANKNYDLSKEQFDYQKQLNELTMQREDTAFQRQVADLKAAGLSPLMVAGNGAAANPLQSSQAPQFDMTGINQAMTNAIGAYNDAFNRKLQSRQFALQSAVQTSQLFTQLAESKLQQKYIKAQTKYLEDKNLWENIHGYRDYDWKSTLSQLLDRIINPGQNTEKPSLAPVIEKAKEGAAVVEDWMNDNATYGDNHDFAKFGAVPRFSPYGHFLDDENYANNRSTGKLIKEEAIEKKNKIDLRIKDNEKNRRELYKYDDYLKSHISEDNWIKADKDFVKQYLKKGHFEGHKKYFD